MKLPPAVEELLASGGPDALQALLAQARAAARGGRAHPPRARAPAFRSAARGAGGASSGTSSDDSGWWTDDTCEEEEEEEEDDADGCGSMRVLHETYLSADAACARLSAAARRGAQAWLKPARVGRTLRLLRTGGPCPSRRRRRWLPRWACPRPRCWAQ